MNKLDNQKLNTITNKERMSNFKKMYTEYMDASKANHNKHIEFSVVDFHK